MNDRGGARVLSFTAETGVAQSDVTIVHAAYGKQCIRG